MTVLLELLENIADMKAFAKRVEVDVCRLDEILQGADPTLYELRKIAKGLKLSVASLVASSPPDDSVKLLFRQAGIGSHPVMDVAVEQLSAKLDASRLFFGPQSPSYSLRWKSEFLQRDGSIAEASENAFRFRRIFFNDDQMGPMHSLPKIVSEKMGVLVFVTRSADFDGASAILDGTAFAFVSARFKPRMLFTLAHEIGHIVGHHKVEEPFAIVDDDIEGSLNTKVDKEAYANSFASSLLMPSQGFALALKKIREVAGTDNHAIGDLEINLLSRIYGVSFWAAALRCESLKLIPRGGAATLQEYVTKAHGSPEKRGEEIGLPQRPEIHFPPVPNQLLQSAILKIRSGEISVGRAAALLELSVADIMAENIPVAH